ncbi:hypothetical protein [Methylobacter psychrophilus]|uniref:hypothetical protein n=1 Tax=Methylobacter psychrophilus TaxID=96941 RepID=UPI0021D4ABA3|nr:hypothetical protein [Methylobacter psychrophilus]
MEKLKKQPLTDAEKKQRQRDKLKASGGKQFTVTISKEVGAWLDALVEASEGTKTVTGILQSITEHSIKRRVSTYFAAMNIKDAGGSLEEIQRFYIDNREQPLTDIADYLPKETI